MAVKAGSGRGIDRRLVRVASHTLRTRVLFLLAEQTASAGEISTELGVSVDVAQEEIEELRKSDLIELVEERFCRGEVEFVYRAVVLPIFSNEEFAELSLEERQRIAAWGVELISSDVAEAQRAGTFNARPDTHTSRTVSIVDEQGWLELNRIRDDALEQSFEVEAASAERLAESREKGIQVMTAMICVEMPARKGSKRAVAFRR